jgi:hypothetical protein
VEHLAELQSKQHYEPNRPHISSVLHSGYRPDMGR